MIHEETSQPKASGISSEAGRSHSDGDPHTQAFDHKYKKGTYRVVKVHSNQVDIRDFRGNISTVHATHVKKTTLTDEVADDYLQLCNEGRFTKKCVPTGYIPDHDWPTIHDDPNQSIKAVKQEEDPNETTVTPAAPMEVEGLPVVLDPKPSSNQPPLSRNNQNAISLKWRLTKWKWTWETKAP